MTPNEIARLQDYLRKLFANERIKIVAPTKKSAPVEVLIDDEFIGVLHRDDEDGEVSYALQMSILEEDLPPASLIGGKKP